MSSTNRGYERHKTDYYITPIQPIKDFFSRFFIVENDWFARPDRMLYLDPCAGGDEYNDMSYPKVIQDEFDGDVITIDIREDSRAELKLNYLDFNIGNLKPDIIITNPPFYIALDIIKKGLEDVKDGGYVIMLLRLNFFGSKERKIFFDSFMPEYCFIHSKRISFMKGATDSIEYAHFVWKKEYYPEYTKTYLI
jgi:hypothetical protein